MGTGSMAACPAEALPVFGINGQGLHGDSGRETNERPVIRDRSVAEQSCLLRKFSLREIWDGFPMIPHVPICPRTAVEYSRRRVHDDGLEVVLRE